MGNAKVCGCGSARVVGFWSRFCLKASGVWGKAPNALHAFCPVEVNEHTATVAESTAKRRHIRHADPLSAMMAVSVFLCALCLLSGGVSRSVHAGIASIRWSSLSSAAFRSAMAVIAFLSYLSVLLCASVLGGFVCSGSCGLLQCR